MSPQSSTLRAARFDVALPESTHGFRRCQKRLAFGASLPESLLTSLAGVVDNCEDPQPGLDILPKADQDNLLPHRSSSIAKSFRGASFRLGGFFFSISWRRIGFERLNQPHRDRSYIVDRSEECRFVRFRRLVETGNFSDELQRCSADFVVGDGRIEIEKRLNVSAHFLIPRSSDTEKQSMRDQRAPCDTLRCDLPILRIANPTSREHTRTKDRTAPT
jgi:hypothetical protein